MRNEKIQKELELLKRHEVKLSDHDPYKEHLVEQAIKIQLGL